MKQLLSSPVAWTVAWYLFSTLVYALPEPTPESSRKYVWTYRIAHAAGSNWDRIRLRR